MLSSCQSSHQKGTLQSSLLADIIDEAQKRSTDALVIYHDNTKVLEWYAQGRSEKIESMSITKSIVGLLFACMQTQGLLDSLDRSVASFYEQWQLPEKKDITVRHIMSHTSGLQDRTPYEVSCAADSVKQGLDLLLAHKPGTRFIYANASVNILAGIAQKITGMSLDEYAKQVLFKPLGITDIFWKKDTQGTPFCFAGLHMHPDDIAKIGLLVLHNGSFRGKQIIAPKFLKELLVPSQTYNTSYGLLWWLMSERSLGMSDDDTLVSYRASGYLGQELVIYFDKNIVGVRMHIRDEHDMKREQEAALQGNEFTLFHPQLNPVFFWDFQKLVYNIVS